jgi:hypothetical protein
MSTRDLINAIEAGDATGIENAFNQAMATKVSEKLEDMRSDVAQNMFASEEVVEEGTEPKKKKPKWLEDAEKNAEEREGKLSEKNWIAGAIKHPGAETAAAKKAGESTHDYEEKHKHDSGTAGKRARLGLTLAKINKKK